MVVHRFNDHIREGLGRLGDVMANCPPAKTGAALAAAR
jgi:hypothetical protein